MENERAQDVHPRQVGRRAAAFPASAPYDSHTARGGVARQFVAETSFTYSRLAGDEEHPAEPAANGNRVRESTTQLREFALAANKLWSRSCGRCVFAPVRRCP